MRKSRFQAKLKAARLIPGFSGMMKRVYEQGEERHIYVDVVSPSGKGTMRALVAIPDKSPLGLMKKRDSKKVHKVLSSWVAYTSRGETVSSNEKE